MNKMRFIIESFSGKSLLVILASILLLTIVLSDVARPQTNENDKQRIVRQVAQKWIQVGVEQYRRGFYKQAEQSFLRAQGYQEYLTAAERDELSELLEKTHIACLERGRILEHIQTAEELEKQGQLIKAKVHLERVKDSEFLTEAERELITEGLKKIVSQLDERKREIAELYNRSVEFYLAGQLEKAREGFIKIAKNGLLVAPAGKTAEDYVAKIDNILAQRAKPSVLTEVKPVEEVPEAAVEVVEEELPTVEAEPAVVAVAEPEAAEPVTDKGGYIEVINRKRNILRSHTRAVVNDAVAKAQGYVNQGQFDKAKEAVETAEWTVNKNQMYLGDELFRQHILQLKQLSEEIVEGQKEKALQLEDLKRIEAIEAQRQYREQMEIDRRKRITELMDNAMAYQKQQRYEEALGQLEGLLAIDPLNDHALILKQTLVDMISFRKQLEVQREINKERAEILIRTDESGIPYAEEITYPKNWREIVARPTRRPDEPIGVDLANALVYEQLDRIVDLSELTPEMPLSEAIEELRNSVEPPLKIVVLWRDLYDNADIDQTTPINMDAISAVPLGAVLELLLRSVTGGFAELGYVVGDGVITIATAESLPSELITQVYDVTDLLGQPAGFRASLSAGIAAGAGDATDIGAGFEEGEEEEWSREELAEMAAVRASSLVMLIQETVEPDSWYEVGGEGSITIYETKKLIVRQTLDVHNKIKKLFKEMRKTFGHQVAIEARFLLVGENFLEDIGLDIDFRYAPGGKWSLIDFQQASSASVIPKATGVPGSLPDTVFDAMTVQGGYGSIALLDDLEVHFLLRATQAHRDAQALTAPKVTVLSGESASLRLQKQLLYAGDIDVETREVGDLATTFFTINYETRSVTSGTILNITPTITPDKKYVLLNITAELRDFLGFRSQAVQLPMFGAAVVGEEYVIDFPETEVSRVQTRVCVPDGGTLLLGGQKLTSEVEMEAGVPILSKIPIIGRAFSSRSKIKDHKILLILVKPTIILQEEAEAEAIAAMEGVF